MDDQKKSKLETNKAHELSKLKDEVDKLKKKLDDKHKLKID